MEVIRFQFFCALRLWFRVQRRVCASGLVAGVYTPIANRKPENFGPPGDSYGARISHRKRSADNPRTLQFGLHCSSNVLCHSPRCIAVLRWAVTMPSIFSSDSSKKQGHRVFVVPNLQVYCTSRGVLSV